MTEYWNAATILFRSGGYAIVDIEDYEWISARTWGEDSSGRARRHVRCEPKEGSPYRQKPEMMHRAIMKAQDGILIDHKNGNCRDNRRSNLRMASYADNSRNMKKRPNTASKYKGVAPQKESKNWYAYITVNYKRKYLGAYKTQEEAAMAYNTAASKYFGEFAHLNVIGGNNAIQ